MKFEVKYTVPAVVCLLVLVLLCQFRSVPMTQLWKGYQVLYVYSQTLSEDDVLAVLDKHGCHDVISRSNQHVPLLSPVAPIQAQNEDSYIFRRNLFFTDKTQNALVFYVPENQTSMLALSVLELSAFQGTAAGTDGKSSFPFVAPLISCLFAVALCFFSKNRMPFLLSCVFPLLFAFSQPLYSAAAGACLCVFALFLFHRLWKRAGFLRVALNSPYILVLFLAPVLVILFSSPLVSVFYALSCVATVSVLYLYYLFDKKQEARYDFKPVFIRSAHMMPVVGHLGIRLFGALAISIVCILAAYHFSGAVSNLAESAARPSLPSPVGSAESSLANMNDVVNWSWNTITFPYRKIGEAQFSEPAENESVAITDYVENADGTITVVENKAYVFNAQFRDMVYNSVEKLDYPALEKMMLKQGKHTSFGYAKSTGASSSEKFGSLLLLVFIAVPIALAVYYIVGRKRYGLSI